MEDVARPRCARRGGRRAHAPQPLTRQAAKREMWWSVVQARGGGAREAACTLEPPEGRAPTRTRRSCRPPLPLARVDRGAARHVVRGRHAAGRGARVAAARRGRGAVAWGRRAVGREGSGRAMKRRRRCAGRRCLQRSETGDDGRRGAPRPPLAEDAHVRPTEGVHTRTSAASPPHVDAGGARLTRLEGGAAGHGARGAPRRRGASGHERAVLRAAGQTHGERRAASPRSLLPAAARPHQRAPGSGGLQRRCGRPVRAHLRLSRRRGASAGGPGCLHSAAALGRCGVLSAAHASAAAPYRASMAHDAGAAHGVPGAHPRCAAGALAVAHAPSRRASGQRSGMRVRASCRRERGGSREAVCALEPPRGASALAAHGCSGARALCRRCDRRRAGPGRGAHRAAAGGVPEGSTHSSWGPRAGRPRGVRGVLRGRARPARSP